MKHVTIGYLAATSRVLAMGMGNMPVHTGIHGSTSIGKTFALNIVLAHIPAESVYFVDAGSPRILIYDKTDLRHKAVVFSEADALPGRGEDEDGPNPAGAAFRALLTDHCIHYDVVNMRAEGGPKVLHIIREGPSVLLTTYTKRLPAQIDSRLFTIDVPEDMTQIRAALAAQGKAEVFGRGKPDESLIAFQALIQAKAPWSVIVPFAPRLAELIADRPSAPRILRDYQRILSLIKSATVIRHQHRQTDEAGSLVALIEDYKTVYDLIGEMYESTAGVSPDVRESVEAVKTLQEASQQRITATVVGAKLGISKKAASRRLSVALGEGWLVNSESRRGYPWNLQIGELVPNPITLPSPEAVGGVSGRFVAVSLENDEETSARCFPVSTVSGRSATGALEDAQPAGGKGERI